MTEATIIALTTSLFAPVFILVLQRLFSKADKKDNLGAKIDNLSNKIEVLAKENQKQNQKIESMENNVYNVMKDLSKVNSNIQLDRKITHKFFSLQLDMDKALVKDMQKLEHNGDLIKAEQSIETFDELTRAVSLDEKGGIKV